MLGKVKLYFGIEGLKIDLSIPESFTLKDNVIEGILTLHSKSPQIIKKLTVSLIETYHRGRGTDKRTNDYEWGKIVMNEKLSIGANEKKTIDFKLSFKPHLSRIDELAHKNSILKKITDLAKITKNAKSDFNIIVKADVEGTALNPEIKKGIRFV